MDSQVVAAIVGGVAGLATGAVSSLVAPWSNWGVEKRRIRHTHRIELVEEWRQGLYTAERANDLSILNDFEWYRAFTSNRRPSLLARLQRRVRKRPRLTSRTVVVSDAGLRMGSAIELENEISRIARKWGID